MNKNNIHMKKNNLYSAAFAALIGLTAFNCNASAQDVSLPTPQKSTNEGSLLKALQDRKSTREFADKALTDQDIADLLWAATGVNRADGHLTVPSAMNRQDITVYVGKADGTFRYDAKTNTLVKIGSSDLRREAGGRNKFIQTAPLVLVIASDTSLQNNNLAICGIDAGAVMQNVYLHCASKGLATVCCYAGDDVSAMQKFLGIKAEMKPLIYMPVGYAK